MHDGQDLTGNTLAAVRNCVAAMEVPPPRDVQEIIAKGRTRRARRRSAAALTTVGVVAGALAITFSNLPTGATPRHTGSPSTGRSPAVLELASYRFELPRGFALRADACAGLSAPPSQGGTGVAIHNGQTTSPVTVLQSMRAAASTDGGCLEAGLAAGDNVVPAGASSAAVGSYQGYVVVASNGDVTLYVTLACESGCQAVTDESHYLVLASEGLTQQQLIIVASSGLPS